MNIAFVKDHNDVVLNVWNLYDTAEALKTQGLQCDVLDIPRPIQTLFKYNAVIFYRSLASSYVSLVHALKKRGIAVGFMIDDLLWDKQFRFAYHPVWEMHVKDFFNLSDFFVFTSDYIAKKAPQHKPIFLRRPAMLERKFDELGKIHPVMNKDWSLTKIVISKGHILPEFIKCINDIFKGCKPGPDVNVFYFSNMGAIYPQRIGRFVFSKIDYLPIDRYFSALAELHPDIILVPMPDDEFNRCKCYPKYLEAGTISSCIMASNVYPYQKVIKDGQNGFLASTTEEFSSKLDWALSNYAELKKIGENAHADIRDNHLLTPVVVKFYKELEAYLINRKLNVVRSPFRR